MESMETTYASIEEGGYQSQYNYIPKLTALAENNISFSNSEKLGGFRCTDGTGWTVSALFATSSGIPFEYPIEGNEDFGNRKAFARGVITLGDILKEKGYHQEFLCGSEAEFGGRRAFYEQHGNYEIYDLARAIEDGYTTDGEVVWWGIEDRKLYDIAKDRLAILASEEAPFNLTMLTVDTHHVDGWICELCGNEYTDKLANVVKCADNQIDDFIQWCENQEWYENTVIVIQGDHPRMDRSLVEGIEYKDRTVFNCFINTEYNKDALMLYNREFTPMDMFPTVLSAMDFKIPDDRLGLGTNMFSGKPTLSETRGYEWINEETSKYSSFYIDNFS